MNDDRDGELEPACDDWVNHRSPPATVSVERRHLSRADSLLFRERVAVSPGNQGLNSPEHRGWPECPAYPEVGTVTESTVGGFSVVGKRHNPCTVFLRSSAAASRSGISMFSPINSTDRTPIPPANQSSTMEIDPVGNEDASTIQVVLDALDDPDCRTILKETDQPMTAKELTENCGIPIYIGPTGTVVSLDISAEMVQQVARQVRTRNWSNVHVTRGDATRAGLTSDTFDAAIVPLALNTMPDVHGALENIHEALQRNGRLVVVEVDVF